MKETNVTQIKICPRCGKAYYEPPAISRMDNQTLICPDCGTERHWRALMWIVRNRKRF